MAISGNIQCFIEANNGNLLAGSDDDAGVFRSIDDGVTWNLVQSLGTGVDATVRAFAKWSWGPIYAAVTSQGDERGIWRSDDNGASWVKERDMSPGGAAASYIGCWDLYISRDYMVAAGMDDTFNLVVEVLPSSLSWLTLPGVNNSSLLDFASPPYAVTRTPHRLADGISYVAETDGLSTQVERVRHLGQGTVEQMAPTSSMGAQPVRVDGWRDLIEFTTVAAGNGWVGHHTILATYRGGSSPATELWLLYDIPLDGNQQIPSHFNKLSEIEDVVRGIYPDPADIDVVGEWRQYPNERTIWAAGDGRVWVSYNSGYTWEVATDAPVNQMRALIRTSAGTLIAGGDNAEVFRYVGTGGPGGGDGGDGGDGEPGGGGSGGGDSGPFEQNTATLGRESTSDDFVPVANKFSLGNVTHILNNRSSAFEHLQFVNNPPYTLFDAAPAVADSVYFGSRTIDPDVPSGAFTSLVFNLVEKGEGLDGMIWEYWDGSAWQTLDVADNTNGFAESGENSVEWIAPNDWAVNTVDGVEGYWVRVRLTVVDTDVEPPVHGGRFVYTVNLPFVEIAEDQVDGNLPALARVQWLNMGDGAGVDPDLAIDRLLIGLRSTGRGPNFGAFLNISDGALPFGQSVQDLSSNGSFIASVTSPTSRCYEVEHTSPGGLGSWEDLVRLSIATSVATDFYGVYRVFLRCLVDGAGDAGSWRFRIVLSFGSGGGQLISKEAFVTAVGEDFVALDLGRIALPTNATYAIGRNVSDRLALTVQGNCADENVPSCLYDLVLMPVDEWSAEGRLPNLSDQGLPNKVSRDHMLDFDSIGNPKSSIEIYHRQNTELIQTVYQPIANGPAILQSGKRQRIWFMAMRYLYADDAWVAPPAVVGGVKVQKLQRYSVMRGLE